MAAHVGAGSTPRSPLSPVNGRRATSKSKKQAFSSPSVNPLALKADWDGDDDAGTPARARPAPQLDTFEVASRTAQKARRPSLAAQRVGELLGAASRSAESAAAAASRAACFEPSAAGAPTRCQIARKQGVYTLLAANGSELLKATHSVVGRWTVSDGRGRYVGKAAAKGAAYKLKRGDGLCVGGLLFSPNAVHASLPPELRLAIPDAAAAAKDVVAALRARAYDRVPTFVSKPVRWDGEGYVLDGFPEDLKIVPSAKNFQLVPHGGDGIALQLARVDKDTYCLEFAGPSPFVAFGAALASIHSYNLFQ